MTPGAPLADGDRLVARLGRRTSRCGFRRRAGRRRGPRRGRGRARPHRLRRRRRVGTAPDEVGRDGRGRARAPGASTPRATLPGRAARARRARARPAAAPGGSGSGDADGALDSGWCPPSRCPAAVGRTVPATNRLGELVVVEWSTGAEADDVVVRDDGTVARPWPASTGTATSLRLLGRGQQGERATAPAVPVTDGRFEAVLELRHELLPLRPAAAARRRPRRPSPWSGARSSGEPVEVPVRLGRLDGRRPARARAPPTTSRAAWSAARGAAAGLLVSGPSVRPAAATSSTCSAPRPGPPAATERCLLMRSYFGEHATDNGLVDPARAPPARLRPAGLLGGPGPRRAGARGRHPGRREQPRVVRPARLARSTTSTTCTSRSTTRSPRARSSSRPSTATRSSRWATRTGSNLQFSQARIDSYDERAAEWDYLVSPARYATAAAGRDFHYPGEVLEIGYPRNDVLLVPGAPDAVRATVRASLGHRGRPDGRALRADVPRLPRPQRQPAP